MWQKGSPVDPDRSVVWLRFVTGRPVSAITRRFLQSCCERLATQGKRHWLLSLSTMLAFHISKLVRHWIREHNQHVKRTGQGVRILPFLRALAKSLAQSH